MKIKHLLTLLLTMATLPALAQGSGIKGKVVSRGDRAAIEQVKITLTPGERQATSDAEGRFRFDDVASGDYTLTFEADDYEPLEIKVRVDKLTKDVRSIALVPVYTEAFDDSIFAEFDTETANDTQSLPSSLSSSKDVFNNIASYKFGEMRFNLRGYDSQYTNVYFNGIRLNDALTGYTPWSLWSGLNDATRNQENTTGLQAADYGLGGIGGTYFSPPSRSRCIISNSPSAFRPAPHSNSQRVWTCLRFRPVIPQTRSPQKFPSKIRRPPVDSSSRAAALS